jgi:predicted transposase/invertase (TIGR01784 family)
LPKPLEKEFWQELKAYEEERKMPYITTGERIGYDRGKVEGKVEGQEEKAIAIALNMLNDNLPLETIARFTGLSIDQLQQLQTESQ